MDKSEGEPQSPPPLTVPLPNLSKLSIFPTDEQDMDLDGDETVVNLFLPSSPTPGGQDGLGLEPLPVSTPAQGQRKDPVWIVKRTMRAPTDPPFMQASTRGMANSTLSRTPQLSKNLTHTPRPVGGFPAVHMSTPPWYNLLPDQREHFDAYPELKVWVRDWQASKDADIMMTSDKLKELVTRMTGEKPRLSTLQPEKDIISKKRTKRHKPPYHFLVSDISERARDTLLAYPIISTPGASAYFLPYNPLTPSFLCTVEGFSLSIRTPEAVAESEEIATQIVQRTLEENKIVVTALKNKLIDDATSQHNMDPATDIIRTLEVHLVRGKEAVDRSATARPRKPLWNIFFKQSPPHGMDKLLYVSAADPRD
ncbi:hypothetical protein C0992_007566 [Termitomyces sp. T32_za158]|nr:hypothetical protein C0992_007566 [Termitomyces sp. T32_za158]